MVDEKNSLHYTKPTFPSWVTNKDGEKLFFKTNRLHQCINVVDIPHDGFKILDCIEDLLGKLFVRSESGCCQVMHCPICGKKARSQP